jgi:uncharacterized membrane protein
VSELSEAKETGRVEAFSDGVFAIAITLLILDIRVPNPPAGAESFDLARALLGLWPSLLAYFMSFAIILVLWVNHHRILTVVRHVDHAFLFWNGLLLMFVTFIPFPTALLAAYMGHGTAANFRVAAVVYGAHGFLVALASLGLWRHATVGERLVMASQREEVRRMWAQYRWGPVAYLVAFLIAFVSPWASVIMCLTFVVAFAFRGFTGRR